MSKISSSEKIEVERFRLELPPDLDIKPIYVVQVSPLYVARVFQYQRDGKDHFAIRIVNKHTGVTWIRDYDTRVGSLLEVKLFIEETAHRLAPKRTQRVEVVESGDED